MSATRSSLTYICCKDLMWSQHLRHTAMPVYPQHENDRLGRGFITSLTIHATENCP